MDPTQLQESLGPIFLIAIGLVCLLIMIGIILFLQSCYARIPQEHRKMEPAMVWLLLIPVFSLVWMFFVYIRLAKSFQGAFAAMGRNEGDCGEKLSLVLCISAVLSIVPLVSCIAGPASFVLLIIVLLKFNTLKNALGQPPVSGGGGAWGASS